MMKINEHDLNEIVDAVIERLRAGYNLTPKAPKAPKPEPATPPAKTILGFDSLGLPRVIRPGESQGREPSALEKIIDRLAAEREAAFKPSDGDTPAYQMCLACNREFYSVEAFNSHLCVQAGRVAPYYRADPTQPMRAATAADAQWQLRQEIEAKAQEILNSKTQGAKNE